jgi:hypothetical protein
MMICASRLLGSLSKNGFNRHSIATQFPARLRQFVGLEVGDFSAQRIADLTAILQF